MRVLGRLYVPPGCRNTAPPRLIPLVRARAGPVSVIPSSNGTLYTVFGCPLCYSAWSTDEEPVVRGHARGDPAGGRWRPLAPKLFRWGMGMTDPRSTTELNAALAEYAGTWTPSFVCAVHGPLQPFEVAEGPETGMWSCRYAANPADDAVTVTQAAPDYCGSLNLTNDVFNQLGLDWQKDESDRPQLYVIRQGEWLTGCTAWTDDRSHRGIATALVRAALAVLDGHTTLKGDSA